MNCTNNRLLAVNKIVFSTQRNLLATYSSNSTHQAKRLKSSLRCLVKVENVNWINVTFLALKERSDYVVRLINHISTLKRRWAKVDITSETDVMKSTMNGPSIDVCLLMSLGKHKLHDFIIVLTPVQTFR